MLSVDVAKLLSIGSAKKTSFGITNNTWYHNVSPLHLQLLLLCFIYPQHLYPYYI